MTSPDTSAAEGVAWQHRVYFNDTRAWSEWRAGRFPHTFDNDFEERELVPKLLLDTSRAETAAANARAEAIKAREDDLERSWKAVAEAAEYHRDNAVKMWSDERARAEALERAAYSPGPAAEALIARAEAAEAKLAKAVEALRPFAESSVDRTGSSLQMGRQAVDALADARRALAEIEGKSK